MVRMPDSPTPAEWRARYAQGPEEFAAALAGLAESDLDISIAEGEWTIRAIINHVAEVEVRATFMMTVAMGNSGAPFRLDWFPGLNKTWGSALAFESRPVAPSLATIRQVRAYFLAQLDAIPDAGERYIMISDGEIGPESLRRTVDELVQRYAEHITEHVAEIGRIRALHGV
jgi:hypothetical protein